MYYPRNAHRGMEPERFPSQARLYPDRRVDLINRMRLVWEQHVYWTRMAVISIAEKRADEALTVARLLRNPRDLANLFGEYYSKDVTNLIERLVGEHLHIGAMYVAALRDGKKEEADLLNRQWYENADKIAFAFSDINPYYRYEDVRDMFYKHLELVAQEAALRLGGNYQADIDVFDRSELQMMNMADMFIYGLMRQFPRDF